jgi:hypothetical protein
MKENHQLYAQQVQKAKETIALLENETQQIQQKLQKNPNSAVYLQELKRISLDMTITLNELEHSESALHSCMVRQKSQ